MLLMPARLAGVFTLISLLWLGIFQQQNFHIIWSFVGPSDVGVVGLFLTFLCNSDFKKIESVLDKTTPQKAVGICRRVGSAGNCGSLRATTLCEENHHLFLFHKFPAARKIPASHVIWRWRRLWVSYLYQTQNNVATRVVGGVRGKVMSCWRVLRFYCFAYRMQWRRWHWWRHQQWRRRQQRFGHVIPTAGLWGLNSPIGG